MTDAEFEEFKHGAVHHMMDLLKKCDQEFRILNYEHWHYDQDTAELVFSDAGIPKVMVHFQIAGSISKQGKSWMWAWANESLNPKLTTWSNRVREFGKEHGIRKLVEDCWRADEDDGWEMTAITTFLTSAKGAYRCPDEDGFLFLVYTDIGFVA